VHRLKKIFSGLIDATMIDATDVRNFERYYKNSVITFLTRFKKTRKKLEKKTRKNM